MAPATSDPNSDENEFHRRLSECMAARISDWHSWLEKERKLEEDLRQTQATRRNDEIKIEKLGLEVVALQRDLERLQQLDSKLTQALTRVTHLEQQASGYVEEIERLLGEQATTETDLATLRQHVQQLQVQTEELTTRLEQAHQQLDAYSELSRFVPEGLHQLLRARMNLGLNLSPGLSNHLARPAAPALEVMYNIVRLQAGKPFSELASTARLEQALEEHRKRGG